MTPLALRVRGSANALKRDPVHPPVSAGFEEYEEIAIIRFYSTYLSSWWSHSTSNACSHE